MNLSNEQLETSIFNRPIQISWLITIILAWCFLVRDFQIPFQMGPTTKLILVSLLICSMHVLYRKIDVLVNIKIINVLWFFGSFVLLIFMNRNTITASLAGDELYHANLSSLGLKVIEVATQSFPGWSWLRIRPMPEIISYLNLLLLGIGLLGVITWNLIRTKVSLKSETFLVLIFLIVIGFLCQNLPNRGEMHPPLRLLPLFLSQLIFGFDDLSFRLAGISLFALLMAYVGNWVTRRAGSALASILAVLSIISIPVVSHVVGIVEPSIWALCCWIGSFLVLNPNNPPVNTQDKHERLIKCGLWIGCASLARQTSIVLWPLVLIYLLIWKCSIRTWIFSLLPGLFMLPVLYTMKQGNHPASSDSPVTNVLQSLSTGAGPQALLNSMTPVWICILSGLIIYVIIKHRRHQIWPYLVILVPSYILYFSIWPYLWGVGRYHAEFLGGLTGVILISLLSQANQSVTRKAVIPVLFIFLYGSFTISTLNQDVHYSMWPQRRITTESVYPYRESLGFLQRQESAGKFVFLGAVPVNGEFFLYLRGFSYTEITTFRTIQQSFEKDLVKIQNIEDLNTSLTQLGVTWMIVQYGEKREKQHRYEMHTKIYQILGEGKKILGHHPYTFIGRYEGAIDLYPLEKSSGY